ncbi:uncharacterized protein LOC128580901 [Nycticebus coucang]|uniref:uncharacterized protein LOC128580901 n=1 Tax=Nycticebus coucang TaxID=9470 RepID=UPI00234DE123|nr:uncharacterized protein LOC128580901 [Nycticebus coucang]
MEKLIILIWLQDIVQISNSFHYIPVNKRTTEIVIEWDEFPKGGNPEFYFLKYQLVNNVAQNNVKSILTDPQKLQKSITLEENKDYQIIIQSIKCGKILSEKSFQTCGISTSNIKIITTTTSVSFNWSVLSSKDISVSISFNNSSQMMQNNVVDYEWGNLKPATLYAFTFEFKQLNLDFINVFQRLYVQVETGSCSLGWVALKNNCYRISDEGKPWNIAQQHCELSLSSAHLVDIKNEEEKHFIFSLLRSNNQIIIWTGLRDIKKKGHLKWTDGSSFGLKKNEIFSFSLIPKNETDCYILQQNATGSNYFFRRFFCYLPLPYICEYELPSLQENFLFYIKNVGTTEVVFTWNPLSVWKNLNKWLKLGYKIIIKYYLDFKEYHFESVPPHTTEKAITQLFPGHMYRFLFFAINKWEAKTSLSPIFIVETRPLSAQNFRVMHVTPTEIFLQWDPPDSVFFHHYLLIILDVENNKSKEVLVEKLNTTTIIEDLKSFHRYLIYLFSVTEKGTLSCFEKPISAVTGINLPQKVYAKPEDVGEDSVILPWEPSRDRHKIHIHISGPIPGPTEIRKLFMEYGNRFKIYNLIPGMTYDIGVATMINGNVSELVTIQQILKSRKVWIVIPYGSHSTPVILFVPMPGIEVFDAIHIVIKGGPNITRLLTHTPSAVEFMNPSRDSNAMTVGWPLAGSLLDGYIISISIGSLTKEEILPSTKRTFTVNSLSPGTDFVIGVMSTKQLKGSHPTVLRMSPSLYPDPPSDLLILEQEENRKHLSWKLLQGGVGKFQISYCMASRKKKLFKVIVDGNKGKIKSLTTGVNCVFQMKTVRGKDCSVPVKKKVTTRFIAAVFPPPHVTRFVVEVFPPPCVTGFVAEVFPSPYVSGFVVDVFPPPHVTEFVVEVFPINV